MILLLLVLVPLAVAVGVLFGWKWVLAPLLGLVIIRFGTGAVRSMAVGTREPERLAEPATRGPERTLYWCEECDTEVMLVLRGDGSAPRHCGARMRERTEILRRH